LKNKSEIESHMQVIRNRRVDTGVADVMSDTMNKLQECKEILEELLYPKLWWDCISCTLRNSSVHTQCEICKSDKPTEMTFEMFVNLKALLYNRVNDHKEITCLFPSAGEEEARVSVKKLQRKVSELSSQHTQNVGRINDLENDDTILADKFGEVETKGKTFIDLNVVDPKQWSVGMVSEWLLQLGIQQYREDFKNACIDGDKLLSCNEISLDKLNVLQKHRPLILNAIAELKTKHKKFKVGRKEPSPVQSQPSNAVCEALNVQDIIPEKGIKVSTNLPKVEDPVSWVTACECTANFLNFSDKEWNYASF